MKKSLFEAGEPSEEVLRQIGIQEKWYDRWPNELSGGELQRFCVARVLKPETRLLIADEMTTMLDALNQAHIWNFILEYAEKHGMSIIAITHNKFLAEKLATRIISIPDINNIEANQDDL